MEVSYGGNQRGQRKSKGSGLNGTALYPAWGYVEELIVAMVRLRSFVDGRA
jgi:hypothetical protein